MSTHKAYFLDADYVVRKGQTFVRLLLKGRKLFRLYYAQDPYFYVVANKEKKDVEKIKVQRKDGTTANVKRVEETTRFILGEETGVLKIFCEEPRDVPVMKSAIPFAAYEYGIRFAQRAIMDLELVPFSLLHYEREGKIIKKFIKFEQGTLPALKTLAFDIETYNPQGASREKKDPVIMISYKTHDKKGVLTTKKVNESYVHVYKDEKELLTSFVELIKKEDPDIIFGYNSSNFDIPYLEARAKENNVPFTLGKTKKGPRKFKRGLADGMQIEGRVHVDLYPMMRFFGFIGLIKAQQFTLEKIYAEVMGKKKLMVTRRNIWEMWDSNELRELSAYSLMDAESTFELGMHFLPLNIEFAILTRLPLFDTVLSTSGQMIENILMTEATKRKEIIPSKPNASLVQERTANPIEGAYVKLPEPGIYENIAVLDFRGLYPSIISSYNIDPVSFARGKKAKESECNVSPTGSKFVKTPRALIPSVVDWLIDYRTVIKKELATLDKDSPKYKELNARSTAVKVATNTVYGYLAFPRSRWYCKEAGESTTAWGRQHIMHTIELATEKGFSVLYGDSLHPNRKIIIQNKQGQTHVVSIGEFVDKNQSNPKNYKTLAFDGKKLVFSTIRRMIRHNYNKEKGDLLEITTTHGKTVVTPQHSVYSYKDKITLTDAKELRKGDFLISMTNPPVSELFKEGFVFDITQGNWGPYKNDIYLYGDKKRFRAHKKGKCPYCSKKVMLANHVNLRHNDRKIPIDAARKSNFCFIGTKNAKGGRIPRYWKLTTDLAWLFGYFAAEGSASEKTTVHKKEMISFGSQDKKIILKVKTIFERYLLDTLAIIEDYDKRINKKMYYYRIQRRPLVALFIYGFDLGKRSDGKKVPYFIINGSGKLREAFLKGYLEGDGAKYHDPRYKTHFEKLSTKSRDLAIGIDYLFKSLSYKEVNGFGKRIEHVYWAYRKDKPGIIDLRLQAVKDREFENFCLARIKEINKVAYDGPVYDLEVENAHNFLDAEGLILVHNTDSLFLLHKNKEDVLTFMKEVNKALPGRMELELEGFYPRGVFVSKRGKDAKGAKKKYALISEEGRIKIRGFELVRRDWSEIAKQTQLDVLNAILREGSKEKAVAIVRKSIERLQKGEVPISELAIETQLKKGIDGYEITNPALTAAQKGIKRGVPIETGSIISYVITKKGKTISEKAELAEFATDYDVEYYIQNQILPAVMKILKELGYDEEDLKLGGKQKGLMDF